MRQMWVLVFGRRRRGGTLVPFALVVQYCGVNVETGYRNKRGQNVACGMKKETSIASKNGTERMFDTHLSCSTTSHG
tara:strand:+ start:201 stop:431 length:231 start_codon:yes stop_codon:yes gene_type:complete